MSESRVTWATSVPILVFLRLSVLDLPDVRDRRQTEVRLRQTDVRQHHRLMTPPYGGGDSKSRPGLNLTVFPSAIWSACNFLLLCIAVRISHLR